MKKKPHEDQVKNWKKKRREGEAVVFAIKA